ncbi:hypothetical protein [Flindersiella endophytica]
MAYKIVGGIGAVLLFVGLLVGLIPVSAEGVNCGSAFAESRDPAVADLASTLSGMGPVTNTEGACESLRSVVRIPAIALIMLGAIGTIAGVSMYMSATAPAAAARARRPKPTT